MFICPDHTDRPSVELVARCVIRPLPRTCTVSEVSLRQDPPRVLAASEQPTVVLHPDGSCELATRGMDHQEIHKPAVEDAGSSRHPSSLTSRSAPRGAPPWLWAPHVGTQRISQGPSRPNSPSMREMDISRTDVAYVTTMASMNPSYFIVWPSPRRTNIMGTEHAHAGSQMIMRTPSREPLRVLPMLHVTLPDPAPGTELARRADT